MLGIMSLHLSLYLILLTLQRPPEKPVDQVRLCLLLSVLKQEHNLDREWFQG